jgi:hypothetical protein
MKTLKIYAVKLKTQVEKFASVKKKPSPLSQDERFQFAGPPMPMTEEQDKEFLREQSMLSNYAQTRSQARDYLPGELSNIAQFSTIPTAPLKFETTRSPVRATTTLWCLSGMCVTVGIIVLSLGGWSSVISPIAERMKAAHTTVPHYPSAWDKPVSTPMDVVVDPAWKVEPQPPATAVAPVTATVDNETFPMKSPTAISNAAFFQSSPPGFTVQLTPEDNKWHPVRADGARFWGPNSGRDNAKEAIIEAWRCYEMGMGIK